MSPIFGPTTTTQEQAFAWARKRGAHDRAYAIIPLYYLHAPRYDIPAENALGQSSWETNDWKYTGQVPPHYHNMAGIKTKTATGDKPEDHYQFDDDEQGVIAHLQHLARYGGKAAADLPDPIVDPRFDFVTTFTDSMEGLGGAWAPAASYGRNVAMRIAELRSTEVGMGTPYDAIIPGMVDIRAACKRNPSGGPNQRRSLDNVRGLVVHFNGPDVSATDDRKFITDVIAPYHCQKDFSRAQDGSAIGDGIMYHVGITRAGEVLLQRDFEDVLWHCGNTEWNERSLSVYVPIGINQRATDAQLAALTRVVDGWRRFTEDGRDLVKGHQELSSTNCPGTLMPDFVLPYRAGNDAQPPAPAEPGAQPDPWRFDNPFGTDFWILNPFVDWIHTHGGFMAVGYVRDGAFIEDGVLVQYFQRYRLEWHPQNAPDSRVLGALLGQEEYQRRYPRGRAA